MAAIAPIAATGAIGAFTATESTLTTSDTIALAPGKLQLLVLRNPTAGTITPRIRGDGVGSTATVLGFGDISTATGYDIELAAGASKAVILSTISAWTKGGTVSITSGTGIKAQLFDI